MVKFSHIKFLSDTSAPWKYGLSKKHSYFSPHNAEPSVIQPGNCSWRILVRLDIICATCYRSLCEDPLPWMANLPLPDTDISAIRLPSVTGREIEPTPLLKFCQKRIFSWYLDTLSDHQRRVCHTLHPQQQHYAVLHVLSLVWECVAPTAVFWWSAESKGMETASQFPLLWLSHSKRSGYLPPAP